MKSLKVTRYLQEPSCCAIASAATISNYYNSNINYELTKKIALSKIFKKGEEEDGLESGETGLLLNYLGFHKVTIITGDLDILDYSWQGFSKKKLLVTLKKAIKEQKDEDIKKRVGRLYKFFSKENVNNRIVITYNFGKYIRNYLNKKIPVIVSYDWTTFHRFGKESEKGGEDPVNGSSEEHAVVINGYNKNGVWVVDSHHEFYKYKRRKYRKGFYHISWENLMTCIGQGDIIVGENYKKNKLMKVK